MADGIKFRPVMGPDRLIKNTVQSNGYFYVATDTGAMYLDVDNHRISVGGLGGASSSFCWANGSGSQIIKLVEDDTDFSYSISFDAIEEGVIPKPDDLILNSDGRFFRVTGIDSDEQKIMADLIAVSGSGEGGGGGGGPEGDLAISVDSTTLARNFILVAGKDYYVSVTGTSTVDEYVSLYFTFRGPDNYLWERTFTARSGEPYLLNTNFLPAMNNVTMTVRVGSDNTTMREDKWPVRTISNLRVIELGIRKSPTMNTASVNFVNTSANVEYYLVGGLSSQEIFLHVYVDGVEESRQPITLGTGVKTVQVGSQLEHGIHTVSLAVSTELQDQEMYSNEISYEIAWVNTDNQDLTPLIWVADYNSTVVRYEPLVIQYQVYDPATSGSGTNDPFTIYVQKNGVRVAEISKRYEAGTWLSLELTDLYEVGENNFALICGTTTKNISFFVTEEGSRDLDIAQKERLVMNLSSLGRSNDEIMATRSVWTSGAYNVNFNNFNWYNNGWNNDNDGNGAYLSVANGASITIPFRNGNQDFQFDTTGQNYTIEVRFRIRNVQEYSTLIKTNAYYQVYINGTKYGEGQGLYIEDIIRRQENGEDIVIVTDEDGNWVMDQKSTQKVAKTTEGVCFKLLNNNNEGLCIGTQEAYFKAPSGTTNVRYKEDEIINFSVVVSNTDHLVSIYLNGILAGCKGLDANGNSFACGNTIIINSDYCDIDIYRIRFFNTGLTMPEVIHNYISDMHNLTLYDRNQITKEDPTLLSYFKLLDYNNQMLDINDIENLSMPYAIFEIIDNTSGMVNPNGGTHNMTDDLLPYVKGGKRYCKITFVNPVLDALYNAGEIDDVTYETHSPSYVCIGAEIDVQGTSSQGYPRRNYKTKMKSATGKKDVNKTVHDDWGWFYTNEKFIEAKGGNASFKKWKQDNPNYGTNKFTWKIDFMESSGSYNTGFANLVGNIYDRHPLAYYNISGLNTTGLRTSVYGFPVLTFHKHSTPTDNSKIGTVLEDEIYEYIGRYNLNQDKSSDELYGFSLDAEQPYVYLKDPVTGEKLTDPDTGEYLHPTIADVAECWEMLDNQGTWTSFSYPTAAQETHFSTYTEESAGSANPRLEVIRHYECRYNKYGDFIEVIADDERPYDLATVTNKINDPDVSDEDKEIWNSIDTIPKMNQFIIDKWANWEKFVTWCDSTDIAKANSERDIEPVTYEVSPNLAEELTGKTGVTINVQGTTNYATFTKDTVEYRLQKFKNEFNKHLNLEYCLVYFVMTELLLCYDSRGKNLMMASYGPMEEDGEYIWFPMFYDIDTQLGLNNVGATLWDYDTDATAQGTFSTASSVLWTNLLKCFEDEIKNKYINLRASNKLNYNTINGAYLCDPDVFDSYAMRGVRPLIAIGLDEYYKYVAPNKTGYYKTTGEREVITDNRYDYVVNGDRILSRELLLRNRLNYIDSYWMAGDYTSAVVLMSGIQIRANANREGTSDKYLDSNYYNELPTNDPGYWVGEELGAYPVNYYDATPGFKVTPFLSQYVFSYNDKQPSSDSRKYDSSKDDYVEITSFGAEEGYRIRPTYSEQIVVFPGENYISSLGDLSIKYPSRFVIDGGIRLLDITIGSDAPNYYNSLLGSNAGGGGSIISLNNSKYTAGGELNTSRKSLLKSINLTNVINLDVSLDMSGSEKLRECRILGTKIPYVTFAEGAPLDCVHLPKTTNRIDLVEATGLTRILTSKPAVWNNATGGLVDRDNYVGLYIEGLTDNDGTQFDINPSTGERIDNSIQRINIIGGRLGYDSYKLLNTAVSLKEEYGNSGLRLRINLEKVEWSPYIMVESGTPYSELQTYYRLTDHSTFTNYTFTSNNQWKIDTLNGLVFTYNNNPDQTLITSTELLDKFIADYESASASAQQISHYNNLYEPSLGYPYLTGSIYIANADSQYAAIDEEDITEKYGAVWGNLNIYAAKVNEAYVAKFIQRTLEGQDKQVDIKRYKQQGTVHPELTSVEPLYPNYDFKGWCLDPQYSIVEQEQFDNLLANGSIITTSNINDLVFSAQNDVFIFYAVFVPHPFEISFDIGDGQIEIVRTPFNHVINLPSTVPYKNESSLPLEQKYAFLGYAKTPTATKPIDMTREIAIRNTKYYAIFKQTDVYSNPIGTEYLVLSDYTINQVSGYSIGLNSEYSYVGKITLPSYINGKPVFAISPGPYNGFQNDNSGKNNITHIFWERSSTGEVISQLFTIQQRAFELCSKLVYVELPASLDSIADKAFANSKVNYSSVNVRYVGESVFAGCNNLSTTFTIGSNVEAVKSYAFDTTPVVTVWIGAQNNPSQLIQAGPQKVFKQCSNLTAINVYTNNPSSSVWDRANWIDSNNLELTFMTV